jgi:hypothetical protein
MTSFWTSVITAPVEDVGSSVYIVLSIAYQDGFQGERGQLEQQHSHVPTLVESVLDIRGPGKVLSAAVWTPDHWHSGVDDDVDHSADPPEACGAPGSRRVSISHWHRLWRSFSTFLKFESFAAFNIKVLVFWVMIQGSFVLPTTFLRNVMLPFSGWK